MRVSLPPPPLSLSLVLVLSPHGIPALRNKLTRWTFYVWYLLRARLGSGFIESYIKAERLEKNEGNRKKSGRSNPADAVLAFEGPSFFSASHRRLLEFSLRSDNIVNHQFPSGIVRFDILVVLNLRRCDNEDTFRRFHVLRDWNVSNAERGRVSGGSRLARANERTRMSRNLKRLFLRSGCSVPVRTRAQ